MQHCASNEGADFARQSAGRGVSVFAGAGGIRAPRGVVIVLGDCSISAGPTGQLGTPPHLSVPLLHGSAKGKENAPCEKPREQALNGSDHRGIRFFVGADSPAGGGASSGTPEESRVTVTGRKSTRVASVRFVASMSAVGDVIHPSCVIYEVGGAA